MIARTTALLAVTAFCFAGCGFDPRPYASSRDYGNDRCRYQGSTYANGSMACQSGIQYRCDNGRWNKRGTACTGNQSGAERRCDLNGNWYAPGSAVCQAGTQYRCDDGTWRRLQMACSRDGNREARNEPSCAYKGATVASQSTICKSGATFLCEAGEWRNLGNPCR
jgi:hypothetical protein